jgi:hypothetical protein
MPWALCLLNALVGNTERQVMTVDERWMCWRIKDPLDNTIP